LIDRDITQKRVIDRLHISTLSAGLLAPVMHGNTTT